METYKAPVCSGCAKVINSDSFMKCSNKKCQKFYEIECLAILQQQFDKFAQEYKDLWICPDCVFAQITQVNLNTLFRFPGAQNFTSPGLQGQASTDQKGQDEGKLRTEVTALRSEIMSRFDRIDSQSASLPNILIEQLCYLNKAGQTDLYTRIRNLEEKITIVQNLLTGLLNQLTSRVMLLESFMGTIQRQLTELDMKKKSHVKALNSSGSTSDGHKSSKTSSASDKSVSEEEKEENNEGAAAVEVRGEKKEKKKPGKEQLENWSMPLL